MHYLFIFTIGPVQSFIAQARKAQDLYAGSQLLSALVKFAFEKAESNSSSFELIFPYKSAASMPNRFVALLSPKENIKSLGENLRIAIVEQLLAIAEKEMGTDLFKVAKDQINDFLESYWAAVPFDTTRRTEDGYYQERYRELEQTLGAVKNFRDYRQFDEEPGRKCSVNGHYNALFYKRTNNEAKENRNPRQNKHLFDGALVDANIDISKLDKGEGICGVTLLRRFYKDKPSFPSVSRIALVKLIEALQDTPEMIGFCVPFGGLEKINEQLFYEDSLTEGNAKEEYTIATDFRNTIDAYKKLKERAKNEGLKFLKYYAILVFDADDMGKHFSKCKTIEAHAALSQRLSEYARWAKNYVNDKRGVTIYAGGDDFLGMLNLVTLFETVQNMREEFDKNFQAEGMTFSAGIAIAHYKTPLGEVLNYARKMEKKAKGFDGKDAFGMVVMKHSGEILETVLPWKNKNKTAENENPIWNTASLKQIHRALEDGVSAAFIKNLHLELPLWENKPNEFRDQSNHEIARYINRAKGNAPEISETIAAVQDLYSMVSIADESNTNFLNALNIVDFLNRKA